MPDAETIAATVRAALEPAGLRRYVAAFRPGDVIGHRGDGLSCPLAHRLNDVLPDYRVSVDSDAFVRYWRMAEPRPTCGSIAFPAWVSLLIARIDRSGKVGAGITARTMLRLIDTLAPEETP